MSGARVCLVLLSGDDRPIAGPIARVLPGIDATTNELLPFRIPLAARDSLPEQPAGYRLSVEESGQTGAARVPVVGLSVKRTGDRGGTIAGRLVGVRTHDIPSSTHTLSIVLEDARGTVLEVIAGEGRYVPHATVDAVTFSLRSDWPLPRDAAAAEAWLLIGAARP